MKAKNIIKEIIIVLLLILAIILILGVLLYEYVPTNKIIPEAVSYTTPEDVKNELSTDTNVEDTQVIVSYEVDKQDLNNYKKVQEYVPGKKNPFASLDTSNTTTENGTNETNTSGTNNNSTTAQNNDNSTGYLPDKGTK